MWVSDCHPLEVPALWLATRELAVFSKVGETVILNESM